MQKSNDQPPSKKNSTQDKMNYCPVSILPILSKQYEKVTVKYILNKTVWIGMPNPLTFCDGGYSYLTQGLPEVYRLKVRFGFQVCQCQNTLPEVCR